MLKLSVPSASGVEAVVKRELAALGYNDAKAAYGRVEFEGDALAVARCNTFLRSGERVLIELTRFEAITFDQVYDSVKAYDWRAIMPKDARILTYGKSVQSKLFAIKSLCSIVKKAIVDKLSAQYGCALTESGNRYMIEISLRNDVAVLTLDTSGDGLHKRGYRSLAYTAPLKETLAAALLNMSYFHKDKHFADVFCGSGTLPIEAAMIALDIAPGINRDFDFEHFDFLEGGSLTKKAKSEALSRVKQDRQIFISGYDISPEAISISRYHAKRAGVGDKIHLQVADMTSFSSSHKYGVMISNPPYGQRLSDSAEVEELYRRLGQTCRALPDWNCYFITPFENFERIYGRRADKKRKLYNANIECCYYSFLSKKPPKMPYRDGETRDGDGRANRTGQGENDEQEES